MKKDAIDVFCPNCNILVEAKVIARGFGEYRNNAVNPIDEVDTEYHGDYYLVALCQRCSGPFLIRETLYGVPGEFGTVTEKVILYPVSADAKYEALPDSIARSMEQAHRSYLVAAYDACALMSRRALEAICIVLSANGSTLAARLVDLKANGRIDARLLDWAHGVRLVGNEAAHNVEATVTADDAHDILEFTEALLMYIFTLDNRFRSFTERRKARADGSPAPTAQQADTHEEAPRRR